MTTLESMRLVATHFNELGVPYTFLGAAIVAARMRLIAAAGD